MARSRFFRQASRFLSTNAKPALNPYLQWSLHQFQSIPARHRIGHVQSDGAGTLFDEYCIAPFYAFTQIFARRNFHLTHGQITGPMGMKKIEHIRHLVFQELFKPWQMKYHRPPTSEDVDILHEEFSKELDGVIADFSNPIPDVNLAIQFIKQTSLPFAFTSGYSRKTVECAIGGKQHLYGFDASTTADEVEGGTRIAMIQSNLLKLKLLGNQMHHGLFVTDAGSDAMNVRSAKNCPWVVGVSDFSTHVGITSKQQLSKLSPADLMQKREIAKQVLLKNGAHAVIDNMSELPLAIVAASRALSRGETPSHRRTLDILRPSFELAPTHTTLGYMA